MSELVPASTRIRSRSVPHVDTDRLERRLGYLRLHMKRSAEWAEQKSVFKKRVVETINIERELAKRGVTFVPVTDGRHLATG